MAAKKKRVDPIKQREKRAKIAAAVGVVLFLAVAAYEVPPIIKMMNAKPPPGANATDAGNRNVDGSIALPSVGAAATGAPATTTPSGELANTDVPPTGEDGQLVSFSVFQTKNPFTPQVSATSPSGTVLVSQPSNANKPGADLPGTTSGTPTTTTTTPTSTVVASAVPSAPSTVPSTTTTVAAPPTVAISVDGVVAHVGSGGTFPAGSPVFRLVSWSGNTAAIGIVGGSYASGQVALTLDQGKPVTLQNTTDGKQYTLELLSTP